MVNLETTIQHNKSRSELLQRLASYALRKGGEIKHECNPFLRSIYFKVSLLGLEGKAAVALYAPHPTKVQVGINNIDLVLIWQKVNWLVW